MRIGIDARMIKATGLGRYIENLILELGKRDKKNNYIVFLKKKEFEGFKVPNENFVKVLADFHWYTKDEQIYFPRIIEKQNLDLMHFPHFNVPLLYKGRYVITIHDLTLHAHKTVRASTKSALTYQFKHFLYKFIIKRAANRALKIIVPSSFTKKDVVKILKIKPEKVAVTLEGGPSQQLLKSKPDFEVLNKFNINKPYIFYVGNCYPHKNIEKLAKATAILHEKQGKDIFLVLAGKEDEFYLRLNKFLRENGYENFVKILGFVTDSELSALYQKASVYPFPSLNEGFGLPPLEAMAFGVPVATSNISCLPEICGEAAVYFDPHSSKDIAEKLNLVLSNEKLRKKLIEKGKQQVKKYSWAKMAQETLKVYEESISKK